MYQDTVLVLHKASRNVLGRLEVPGVQVDIPEQKLRIILTETSYIIETDPENCCLKFRIEMPREIEGENDQLLRFQLEPSDSSVEAGILFTRIAFSLMKARRGLLYIEGINEPLRFDANLLPEARMRRLLYRAKIFRKLKYIQDILKVKFTLPKRISAEEVKQIEIVFRGITEGEFTTRSKQETFKVASQDIDLDRPPFSGPGHFDASIGDKVALFGQQLVVGLMTVHLGKTELANHGVVELIRKGSNKLISLRLEVLDNQIRFHFQDYARTRKEDLVSPLEQFRQRLISEEPEELADLITDFLANDVSPFEAIQIAVGWQFYNHLPDRYCPQEPILDEVADHWRVPIWLVYANGEGGYVGEVIIDKKTGEIIYYTPIEELRREGLALAEKILNAQ